MRAAFTTKDIANIVRRVAAAAGETDLEHFSAHSLRIGGATDMHAMGVPYLTIALLGRWSSDIARTYTRASQAQVLSISSRLAAAPDDPTLEEAVPGYVQTARR